MDLAQVKYWRDMKLFAMSSVELRIGNEPIAKTNTVECIDWLIAEVERLNKWADSFSDAQLEERATGERYQQELRTEVERLTAENAKYKAALEAFVNNAYEQSRGASDFVVTTCEALEGAKAALPVKRCGCGEEIPYSATHCSRECWAADQDPADHV